MIALLPPELPTPMTYSDATRPDISYLPKTLAELKALSDEDKILLAAVTASGCDAVAYYKPSMEGFELQKQIALYPGVGNVFGTHIDRFKENTFAYEDAVISNPTYHIPVRTQQGTLKGIIILHAPTQDYSRVQNAIDKVTAYDAHEPANVRQAKLEMALHIVERHQDLFGFSGQRLKELEKRHRTINEKIDFFSQFAKDMFASLPRENGQTIHPDKLEAVRNARNPDELKAALRQMVSHYKQAGGEHLVGVADLTRISTDALNATSPDQPLISEKQAYLIELLALLHDVGKAQMSSTFFRHWESPVSEKEQNNRERYATAENHNHPLFTLLTELFYAQEGMINAAHHQSFGRYTQAELKEKMGKNYKDFNMLNDDIPPDQLPVLSKIMRVADVTEAVSDSERNDQPLDKVLRDMANRAGYDSKTKTVQPVAINARTIDPDCLCFMIDSGVFDTYGRQREQEKREGGDSKGWWSNAENRPKYDAALVGQTGQEILAAFNWEARKDSVIKTLREQVAADAFISQDSIMQQSPQSCVRGFFPR